MRSALAPVLLLAACGARSELLVDRSDGTGGAGSTATSTSTASSSASSSSSSGSGGGGPIMLPACAFDSCAHAQCPPITLASSTHPIWVDSDGAHVFWATDNPPVWVDTNGVHRVDKSGANIVSLLPGHYVSGVPHLAPDAVYLGMGDSMETRLLRVPKDGDGASILGTWAPPAVARSVHVDGATAYQVLEDVDVQQDEVARVGVDGSTMAPLAGGFGVDSGTNTALLGDALALYTLASNAMGKVSLLRIEKADGAVSTLAIVEYDGVIAQDGDYVYLGDYTPNPVLVRVPKAGGPAEILAPGVEIGALAVGDGFVYFADALTGVVSRVPAEGGLVEEVIAGLPSPSALSLVDHTLYLGTETGLCRLDL